MKLRFKDGACNELKMWQIFEVIDFFPVLVSTEFFSETIFMGVKNSFIVKFILHNLQYGRNSLILGRRNIFIKEH